MIALKNGSLDLYKPSLAIHYGGKGVPASGGNCVAEEVAPMRVLTVWPIEGPISLKDFGERIDKNAVGTCKVANFYS